jgi:hypothetical protein
LSPVRGFSCTLSDRRGEAGHRRARRRALSARSARSARSRPFWTGPRPRQGVRPAWSAQTSSPPSRLLVSRAASRWRCSALRLATKSARVSAVGSFADSASSVQRAVQRAEGLDASSCCEKTCDGRLSALHAGCRGFESLIAHSYWITTYGERMIISGGTGRDVWQRSGDFPCRRSILNRSGERSGSAGLSRSASDRTSCRSTKSRHGGSTTGGSRRSVESSWTGSRCDRAGSPCFGVVRSGKRFEIRQMRAIDLASVMLVFSLIMPFIKSYRSTRECPDAGCNFSPTPTVDWQNNHRP